MAIKINPRYKYSNNCIKSNTKCKQKQIKTKIQSMLIICIILLYSV